MIVAPPVSASSSSVGNERKKNELFPKCLRTKQVAYPCMSQWTDLRRARFPLSVSNLKTSQSVLDYHELKRLQGISDGSDHRSVQQQIDGEKNSRVIAVVLGKKHIRCLWSNIHPCWSLNRHELGYHGRTRETFLQYLESPSRSKK